MSAVSASRRSFSALPESASLGEHHAAEPGCDSAIGAGGRAAFNIGYTYSAATGGRQTVRRATMTGTSFSTLTYGYGSGSGIDDCASRVQTMTVGAVTISTYKYLGMRQVSTELNEVYVFHDPDYTDWDRFNRPVKNWWTTSTAG